MTPIPTVWWLRPDSRAARVGAHSAVVWKRLYVRPFAASRSAVGVTHGPPNALEAAKPTSSSRTTSTLGAPAGGCSDSIAGNDASGSLASSGSSPSYGRSGIGRTSRWTERSSLIRRRSSRCSAPYGVSFGHRCGPWHRPDWMITLRFNLWLHADRMMRSRPLRANVLRMHTRDAARAGMVAVPRGEFLMGSAAFYPEERPVHRVAVEAFWIDARPVTVGQFRRFVTETGYVTIAERPLDPDQYP